MVIYRREMTSIKRVTNRVTIDFYMFSTLMKYQINSNWNDTSVICMKRIRANLRKAKLTQQSTEPNYLRAIKDMIFRLNGGLRYAVLLLTFQEIR